MKMPKWLLLKWLHYGLLAVFLLFALLFLLPAALSGHEIATNLFAEVFGLLCTLIMFVILLELREKLEWKVIEDKVKGRMNKQISLIFVELLNLCKAKDVVANVDIQYSEINWGLERKQLSELLPAKIKLNDVAKSFLADRNKRMDLASFLDSRRTCLSEIEEKYLKFLDYRSQEPLMNIQDCLVDLCFELRVKRRKTEDFHRAVTDLIGKIMEEIALVNKSNLS